MHLPTFDTQSMNPRDCFDLRKETLFSVLPSWILNHVLNIELINKEKGEIKNTTNKTASFKPRVWKSV